MDRPLSRLQLAAAIIIIALCFGWAVNRMAVLAAVAEATAVELTIRNLKSGIMGYVSVQLLKYDYSGIAGLARANPVGVVIDPPPGYIGSVRQADPENIAPGQWYYDEDNAWLAYHVVNADYLEQGAGGPARIRMRLSLNYDDVNGNGAYDPGIDRAAGISLQVLDDLNWKF
ncbi:MAG: hypothetical protein HYY36_06590 [Gammaproteobacteria bacterium]|nr:hypothetical protein [Gammaproteobacteria bacterium]